MAGRGFAQDQQSLKIMTKLQEQVPANSVPAAAVRQGGQALFRMTGRKGHVGGI